MSDNAFEPSKRIDGCRHTGQRMIQWINDGACPICLTAAAGINLERAKAAERDREELIEALREAAGLRGYLAWMTMSEEGFRKCSAISEKLDALLSRLAAKQEAS